jgi:hypothetical protein
MIEAAEAFVMNSGRIFVTRQTAASTPTAPSDWMASTTRTDSEVPSEKGQQRSE